MKKMLAVIADSPSLPRRELEEALALGKQFNFHVEVIKTDEMNDANYTSNPPNRCYFCKSELFESLVPLAKSRGFAVIERECVGDVSRTTGRGKNASGPYLARHPTLFASCRQEK